MPIILFVLLQKLVLIFPLCISFRFLRTLPFLGHAISQNCAVRKPHFVSDCTYILRCFFRMLAYTFFPPAAHLSSAENWKRKSTKAKKDDGKGPISSLLWGLASFFFPLQQIMALNWQKLRGRTLLRVYRSRSIPDAFRTPQLSQFFK